MYIQRVLTKPIIFFIAVFIKICLTCLSIYLLDNIILIVEKYCCMIVSFMYRGLLQCQALVS